MPWSGDGSCKRDISNQSPISVTDTKSILTNLCSHFAKVSLMSGAALLCLAGIGKIWSIGPLYLFGDILLSHYAGITLGVAEIVLGIVACMFASQRAIRAVMLAIYLGFLVTLGLKYLNGATYCNCLPGVESSLPTMFFLDTLIVAGVLLSFFINVKLTDMQIRGLRGLFAATAISAVVLSLNYSSADQAFHALAGLPLTVDQTHKAVISAGDVVSVNFVIKNHGTTARKILGAKSSCHCTVLEGLPAIIPPKGEFVARMTIAKIAGQTVRGRGYVSYLWGEDGSAIKVQATVVFVD